MKTRFLVEHKLLFFGECFKMIFPETPWRFFSMGDEMRRDDEYFHFSIFFSLARSRS